MKLLKALITPIVGNDAIYFSAGDAAKSLAKLRGIGAPDE